MAPPYRIGKGPIVVAMEMFLAQGDLATYYDELVDEDTYLKKSTPTTFDRFLKALGGRDHDHLMDDVFGPGNAALGPPAAAEAATESGLSRRLVYGRGIRRALEIAYGFGSGGPLLAEPWDIDIFWGCGQPFNSVVLRTNAAKKIVTAIIYSDEPATADPRRDVVEVDTTKPLVPDEAGDLFFVDDRAGIGTVKEWRATTALGFAGSPAPA
jgi:hypothetical protein